MKGSGNLICTVGMLVASIIVTGAGTGIGAGACLKVLIFGAGRLGCSSSLLISSSVVSVLYMLLLGATADLGSILTCCSAQLSLGQAYLVGLVTISPWMVLV